MSLSYRAMWTSASFLPRKGELVWQLPSCAPAAATTTITTITDTPVTTTLSRPTALPSFMDSVGFAQRLAEHNITRSPKWVRRNVEGILFGKQKLYTERHLADFLLALGRAN